MGSIGNQIILKPDNTPENYPYIPSMSPYLTDAGGRTKDDYTECTGNGQQQFLVGKGIYTGLRSRFRILRQPL